MPLDINKIHPSFKGGRFRAVNMANIHTGEIVGWRILFRQTTKDKWRFIGDASGPLAFAKEAEAKKAARKLNVWSRANDGQQLS